MAEESAKQPKKRIVKNPETFRERAVKASEEGDKPSRTTALKQFGGRAVSPAAQPIGRAGSRLAQLKLFKWLRPPARLVGRIIFPVYFRNSWQELRRVKWPSWQQSRRLTFAVLIFAIVFGAAIAIVDYGLDKLFRHILLK